jgi:hypothetical protein
MSAYDPKRTFQSTKCTVENCNYYKRDGSLAPKWLSAMKTHIARMTLRGEVTCPSHSGYPDPNVAGDFCVAAEIVANIILRN